MLRLTPLVALMSLVAIGCVDRARVNSRCEWSHETLGALRVNDPEHQRHLARDIELATELDQTPRRAARASLPALVIADG